MSRMLMRRRKPATPTYVGESHVINAASGASIVIPYSPANVQQGHLLVAMITYVRTSNGAQSITTPTGWTLLNTNSATATFNAYYWRWVGSETSVTFTSNVSANNWGGGTIRAYTDVHPTSPINTHARSFTSAASTTRVTPALTTTVANCLLDYATCSYLGAATAFTHSWAGGPIETADDSVSFTGATARNGLSAGYEIKATAGAVTTRTITTTQSTSGRYVVGVAIAPLP